VFFEGFYGFLKRLKGSRLLECSKLVQIGQSFSLAIQQPAKNSKKIPQKMPKMTLEQLRGRSKLLEKFKQITQTN
jgi:hypothetical protein